MGHSSRSRSTTPLNRSPLRDVSNTIARGRFLLDELLNLPDSPSRPLSGVVPSPLSLVEDNRLWHPLNPSPAKFWTGGSAKISERPRRSNRYNPFMLSGDLGFINPQKVIRCVRRKMRREVIFALDKQRKGSGSKRRRRNEYSSISC